MRHSLTFSSPNCSRPLHHPLSLTLKLVIPPDHQLPLPVLPISADPSCSTHQTSPTSPKTLIPSPMLVPLQRITTHHQQWLVTVSGMVNGNYHQLRPSRHYRCTHLPLRLLGMDAHLAPARAPHIIEHINPKSHSLPLPDPAPPLHIQLVNLHSPLLLLPARDRRRRRPRNGS